MSATLEVATTSALLTGRCPVFEQSWRLVDVLRQITILVLTDCTVRPIGQPSEPISAGGTSHVPVGHIVWARPMEAPDSPAADRERTDDDRIEKVPHPLVAVAQPFVIEGNVHLVQGADPTIAFERLAQGFLPVTQAKVTCAAGFLEAPFIAVNGLLVELFSLDEIGQAAA